MSSLNKVFKLELRGEDIAHITAALEFAMRNGEAVPVRLKQVHDKIVDQVNLQMRMDKLNGL